MHKNKILLSWQQSETKQEKGLISQPLLLPVSLTLSAQQIDIAQTYQASLVLAGIIFTLNEGAKNKSRIQIRQFPAMLREKDVTASFIAIIHELSQLNTNSIDSSDMKTENNIISAVAKAMLVQTYSEEQAQMLWLRAQKTLSVEKIESILLNSVPLDLTSQVKQLEYTSNDSVLK